jgi:hypothetical protein
MTIGFVLLYIHSSCTTLEKYSVHHLEISHHDIPLALNPLLATDAELPDFATQENLERYIMVRNRLMHPVLPQLWYNY